LTPPPDAKTYRYTTTVQHREATYIAGTYKIPFPYDVRKEFGTGASVRVVGRINGVTFRRGLIPQGDGTHCMLMSLVLAKELRIFKGDEIEIEVWRDPNPKAFDMPEELEEALNDLPELKALFIRLPHGMRKNMASWVSAAKRPSTRAERTANLLHRLEQPVISFGGRTLKREEVLKLVPENDESAS